MNIVSNFRLLLAGLFLDVLKFRIPCSRWLVLAACKASRLLPTWSRATLAARSGSQGGKAIESTTIIATEVLSSVPDQVLSPRQGTAFPRLRRPRRWAASAFGLSFLAFLPTETNRPCRRTSEAAQGWSGMFDVCTHKEQYSPWSVCPCVVSVVWHKGKRTYLMFVALSATRRVFPSSLQTSTIATIWYYPRWQELSGRPWLLAHSGGASIADQERGGGRCAWRGQSRRGLCAVGSIVAKQEDKRKYKRYILP